MIYFGREMKFALPADTGARDDVYLEHQLVWDAAEAFLDVPKVELSGRYLQSGKLFQFHTDWTCRNMATVTLRSAKLKRAVGKARSTPLSGRFSLTACPMDDETRPDGRRRRTAITTRSGMMQWFCDRAHRGMGILVKELAIDDAEWRIGIKQDTPPMKFWMTTYSGRFVVADVETFSSALHNGIGHARRFGSGMLRISQDA